MLSFDWIMILFEAYRCVACLLLFEGCGFLYPIKLDFNPLVFSIQYYIMLGLPTVLVLGSCANRFVPIMSDKK